MYTFGVRWSSSSPELGGAVDVGGSWMIAGAGAGGSASDGVRLYPLELSAFARARFEGRRRVKLDAGGAGLSLTLWPPSGARSDMRKWTCLDCVSMVMISSVGSFFVVLSWTSCVGASCCSSASSRGCAHSFTGVANGGESKLAEGARANTVGREASSRGSSLEDLDRSKLNSSCSAERERELALGSLPSVLSERVIPGHQKRVSYRIYALK